MKKNKLISVNVLVFLFSILFSCSKDNVILQSELESALQSSNVSKKSNEDIVRIYKGEFKSWKEQLDFAKNEGGTENILGQNGLKLLGYTDNNEKVISGRKLVSERETGFRVRELDGTKVVGNFSLEKVGKSSSPPYLKGQLDRKKAIFSEVGAVNDLSLKIVLLQWDYKGQQFSTRCIVSESLNTVIYDDILSNITITSFSSTQEKSKTIAQKFDPLAITSSYIDYTEYGGDPDDNWDEDDNDFYNVYPIQFSYHQTLHKRNFWNTIVATAQINFYVEGLSSRNKPVKKITSFYASNYKAANGGYSAEAVTSVQSHAVGVGGHVNFGWAVGVGESATLTISGSGVNISVGGGSTGMSGSQYVLPDDLY